jgi:hypothetical protein
MTQEQKDLLLKDLCSRLPYGVKISVQSWDEREMEYIDKVDTLYSVNGDKYIKSANEDYDFSIEDIKPYLFPLSSMTEEQRKEFVTTLKYLPAEEIDVWTLNTFNWCDKNHFDYRGLIPIGAAIDATNKNIY